ncbi:uncharacterized protein BKA55DRAFT_338704 [Fusarium redolens]|uniref:Uncharacterized protein n=1 Tax=Fusarium redolens TaxID=48865 RepID=A0A9P9HAF4_FUSRE|nr:uncharacterized protein BKA55DRAFT_338704 [Fusarium redolens]KAH7253457.1 hypothetical protein BKA55DRAFT_338704 [Fusarium redolens]
MQLCASRASFSLVRHPIARQTEERINKRTNERTTNRSQEQANNQARLYTWGYFECTGDSWPHPLDQESSSLLPTASISFIRLPPASIAAAKL